MKFTYPLLMIFHTDMYGCIFIIGFYQDLVLSWSSLIKWHTFAKYIPHTCFKYNYTWIFIANGYK